MDECPAGGESSKLKNRAAHRTRRPTLDRRLHEFGRRLHKTDRRLHEAGADAHVERSHALRGFRTPGPAAGSVSADSEVTVGLLPDSVAPEGLLTRGIFSYSLAG